MEKIVSKEEFQEIREMLKMQKKKVVLCHGVYDLLHYGHIEHLKEAKAQGDILVVSVTSAPFVNKGPDRPYYNDKQRLSFLEAISFIDYIILSEEPTAKGSIHAVKPDVYVKGQEFRGESDGITGHIKSEADEVIKYGGVIYYTEGEVHSSSKLLNNYFDALPEDVITISKQLREKYGAQVMEEIRGYVEGFGNMKVLVVGDIILDEYIFCRAQGLTSKDTIISTRYESEERYLGGSLAIARHIANFSENVTLLSMMGKEGGLYDYISKEICDKINVEILQEENFVTPIKRRFLKQHPQRQEYDKLFSINMLTESESLEDINYSRFYEKLDETIEEYDLVVLCDYGHGLIDEKAQEIIEEKSKYLAVNCQTNSSNYGTNLMSKYHRADTFALDEKELRLAFGQARSDLGALLLTLMQKLNTKVGWLTLGANGAMVETFGGWENEKIQVPALTLHVKDTVGAGDAFYAISSLCAAKGVPADLATLMANASAAIKTHLVGNTRPVGKTELLKFVNTVLNV